MACGMPGGQLSVFEHVGRLGGSFKTRKLDENANQALTVSLSKGLFPY